MLSTALGGAATTTSLALEAVEVSKRYGRSTLALDGVSLSLRRGSIAALVGPNAAGKSTLMKTWVAFERPTSGFVAVHGIDPRMDKAGAIAHIGYVPQQPALYRGLTVDQHLEYAAHVRPAFDRQLAADRLTALGIPLGSRPTALSGGQAAQVMLSLAMDGGADTLLLDEPLASLDPLARTEFMDALEEVVRGRGATALLSSHIVTDLEDICDHLIVLGMGRVLLDQPIEAAKREHWIVREGLVSSGSLLIASMSVRAEKGIVQVVRASDRPDVQGARLATLDEIVRAYLTAGREPASERSG